MTYAGADTWGRLQRMRGRTVFQPIGFDAFGINAENYALRAGVHPRALIASTVDNYRRQLRRLGCGWSWRTEVVTSDPAYYRWTQWVFLRLLAAGLAYRAAAPVVWCPSCLTVLAREQVEDERCERCATRVTEQVMTQWFLRTTSYAPRLARGLDALDWPERAKNRQRSWIRILHDWLLSRQRYWGTPIPVVHCDRCEIVPVPEHELPVLLPKIDDPQAIRPTGTARSPLASIADWARTRCPQCGRDATRETDVCDTFFDSSWYFLRYPSADIVVRPWDNARTARWLPVDQYAGGPEHVTRHHLYARFVTMALHDQGLVPFAEPFPRVRLHGMLTMAGAKMSKSRGNMVNPDELLAIHGADVTRLGLLFGRPWDADGDFEPGAIAGAARFASRVRRVVVDREGTAEVTDATIDKVTAAIDRLQCNVAVAALMSVVPTLDRDGPSLEAKRTLVRLLAPLAPHLAEDLWARLGGHFSVHTQPWPQPMLGG